MSETPAKHAPSPQLHERLLSPRAATAYAVGAAGWAAAKRARAWYDGQNTWTLSISDTDSMYAYIADWLVEILPTESRTLVIRTGYGRSDGGGELVSPGSENPRPRSVYVSHDDTSQTIVQIGGHPVSVAITRPDSAALSSNGRMSLAPDRMTFTCRSVAARKAVVEELRRVVAERSIATPEPMVHLLGSWGHWMDRRDLPLRPLDTVVLAKGQSETLVGSIEHFLAAEAEYIRRGQPWHHNILLHGEPGTGKTSIPKGLADHFGMDLWYAPLQDLSHDTSLLQLISQIRPRSILLLEDFDHLPATHDEDAGGGQISMDGLLQALDGVATPHGLIVVMTTNHLSKLDPAIVRPGRVNLSMQIGEVDPEQAERLFVLYYGREPTEPLSLPKGATTALLVNLFNRHDNGIDAETALGEIA
jgi:hypothetical protein